MEGEIGQAGRHAMLLSGVKSGRNEEAVEAFEAGGRQCFARTLTGWGARSQE
jgi:hypothetical protein